MNIIFSVGVLNGLFSILPIKRRKIFFLGYYGSQYGCNPKYLSEYIVRNHPDWDVVWGFTQPKKYEIAGIRKVRYLSLRFFYELCTSSVFVTNYRMPKFYRRRSRQTYIQTWHSSLRLKAIEADAQDSTPAHYIEMAKHDSRQISMLLSGCQKSTEIFQQAFWYNGLIVPTGTPRMDILLSPNEELRHRVRAKLRIEENTHVVLFAPTFRENHDLDAYDLDLDLLCDSLQQRWGGTWKVLLRLHPHLQNLANQRQGLLLHAQDVTSYDDPQELLCISDVVVSDYSGLIFDFAYTRRPCFLYVPDLKGYLEHERHLYFNIEELPFPIIHDNVELSAVIREFDKSSYEKAVDGFLSQIGSFETGHACENVFQLISNLSES